ncbi:MAG: hypothetical protein HGA36_02980 [Candidatus Moranbacteria bacterium]|nr:hypothetical protein [Candidatus Moranbacteria bacterium]
MNNKLIILATTFFILVSFIFLSFSERKQADIDALNVWMLYFESPKDNSLGFVIENHTVNTQFHWEIMSDDTITNQGDVDVKAGVTKKIPVSATNIANKKFTIIVTSGDTKKEIYKNL